MRPARALPLTWARSTPSSRANRRTAGLACGTFSGIRASASKATGGLLRVGASLVAGVGAGRAGSAAFAGSTGFAGAGGAGGAGLAASGAGVGSAAAAGSIMATTEPSDSSSPTLTLSSRTMPSNGAGTSMVALSDSSVTRPWSFLTTSPGCTSSSITGTSLSSPISGTRASFSSAMVHLGSAIESAPIVPRSPTAAKRRPKKAPVGTGALAGRKRLGCACCSHPGEADDGLSAMTPLESTASLDAAWPTMRVRMVTVTEGMDCAGGGKFPPRLNRSRGLDAGLTGS